MDCALGTGAEAWRDKRVRLGAIFLCFTVFSLRAPAYLATGLICRLLSQVGLTNLTSIFFCQKYIVPLRWSRVNSRHSLRFSVVLRSPSFVKGDIKQFYLIELNHSIILISVFRVFFPIGAIFTAISTLEKLAIRLAIYPNLLVAIVDITHSESDPAHFNHRVFFQLDTVLLIENCLLRQVTL